MKRIAVAHLKGGVGKTTTAVTLAHLAALGGYRTLLVDLDAQGAAGYILGMDADMAAKAKSVIRAKKDLTGHIYETDYPNLDILPGSLSFRKLPHLLAREKDGADGLGALFRRVGKGYDVMVVDAPAGLSLESEAILRGAELVLAPVVPSPLALTSFETLAAFVGKMKSAPTVAGFYAMVDRRRKLHREVVENPAGIDGVWPVIVPAASVVERMTDERRPLADMRRSGAALAAYRELWWRVATSIGLEPPA